MNVPRIAIVNYGVGNLFSIRRACEINGMNAVITSSAAEIKSADAVILPGVGAFATAMDNLRELNLVDSVKLAAESGKPFAGICLGYQLLFDKSLEFGEHEGLSILRGDIVILNHDAAAAPAGLKIPHVCWNKIKYPISSGEGAWAGSLLDGIPQNTYMYFVHSYIVRPADESSILTMTEYGGVKFCSAVEHTNIFACQFHPERSGAEGLKVYANLRRNIERGTRRMP